MQNFIRKCVRNSIKDFLLIFSLSFYFLILKSDWVILLHLRFIFSDLYLLSNGKYLIYISKIFFSKIEEILLQELIPGFSIFFLYFFGKFFILLKRSQIAVFDALL